MRTFTSITRLRSFETSKRQENVTRLKLPNATYSKERTSTVIFSHMFFRVKVDIMLSFFSKSLSSYKYNNGNSEKSGL